MRGMVTVLYLKFLLRYLKPLSVTTNVVGLQTDDAGHVGQDSSTHVAHVVGLQTDAVVVTETHLSHEAFFFFYSVFGIFFHLETTFFHENTERKKGECTRGMNSAQISVVGMNPSSLLPTIPPNLFHPISRGLRFSSWLIKGWKILLFSGATGFRPILLCCRWKKGQKRPEKGQENADYRFFLFGTSSLSKVGVTRRQGPLKYLGFFSVNRSDSKLINQTRLVHYLPRSCALHKILSYLTLLNKI